MNVKAKPAASLSAGFDKKRNSVVFQIKCHDGTVETYACQPEAVPEIIARLMAAQAELAKETNKPVRSIVVEKAEISFDPDRNHVGLVLYPNEKTGIPFHLDPERAQEVSTGLAHASAKVHPKKPQKQN